MTMDTFQEELIIESDFCCFREKFCVKRTVIRKLKGILKCGFQNVVN